MARGILSDNDGIVTRVVAYVSKACASLMGLLARVYLDAQMTEPQVRKRRKTQEERDLLTPTLAVA
ncbi:MAG: hypothetical protein WCH96_01135 [Betaproteobacteria bacterium]|jgi:predicted secreted Zn-dependent protease